MSGDDKPAKDVVATKDDKASVKDTATKDTKDVKDSDTKGAAKNATKTKDAKDSKDDDEEGDVPPVPPRKDSEDGAPGNVPAKPQRPPSPFSQTLTSLKDAFPDADTNVVRAVAVASGNNLENAFNGMLALTDDTVRPIEVVPAAAASATPRGQARRKTQIEEDEELARKLAQEFNRPPRGYTSSRTRHSTSSAYSGRYDDERPQQPQRSFLDDDLPEIRENLQKGFEETKTKVSAWYSNFKKRLDGEEGTPGFFGALGQSPRNSNELRGYDGPGSGGAPRRSGDGDRRRRYYDRDPAEIDDDFRGISLRDDTEPERTPPRPPRPGAKPRQVSAFGDEAPATTGSKGGRDNSTSKSSSKWEPLTQVPAEPVGDKDPFFIGDSDEDEEDDKPLATLKDDSKSDSKADSKSDSKADSKSDAKSDAKSKDDKDSKDESK